MKTQEDLYLEYAKVIQMTRGYNEKHGTDVKPWECVKYIDTTLTASPYFDPSYDNYTFAIAILEGKPVFVGDKLYGKISENLHEITELSIERNRWNVGNESAWSWTPQQKKRTFEINGVELPCPNQTGIFCLTFNRNNFCFDTTDDYYKVANFLGNLLAEARDKE